MKSDLVCLERELQLLAQDSSQDQRTESLVHLIKLDERARIVHHRSRRAVLTSRLPLRLLGLGLGLRFSDRVGDSMRRHDGVQRRLPEVSCGFLLVS